jgi:hypothetical protein
MTVNKFNGPGYQKKFGPSLLLPMFGPASADGYFKGRSEKFLKRPAS